MGNSAAWDRVGAVSGIFFALLVILAIRVSASNADASAPSDISGIVAIDFGQRRDDLRLAAFFMTAGVFFLSWFIPFLRHRLEAASGGGGWVPSVAYGSGMTAGAMLLVLASFGFAASVVESYEGDWQVAKTILILSWDHLIVLAPALAALVAATSVVSIHTGGLPAWLGWASLLLVLAPLVVAPELMTMIFLVWVIALSVALLYQTFTDDAGYLG